MSLVIVDGTGNSTRLRITSDNRAATDAIVTTRMTSISEEDEQAFLYASGGFAMITSTGVETGILYIKNTSATKLLKIFSIRTCGTEVSKWKLYKNISGGTLLTGAVAAQTNNMQLSSPIDPESIAYKGAEGDTIVGGTMLEHLINERGHSTEEFGGALILDSNDSIALTVEVDTASEVCCRVIAYFTNRDGN